MLSDLRFTLRLLKKHPSFLLAGVVVLGVAVGVNTAVFSLVNAFLLRPLPVAAPRELVFVYPSSDRAAFPYAWFRELAGSTDVFAALAARAFERGRMRAGNELIPLEGEAVSWNYFDVLGVAPRIGRTFRQSDEHGSEPVAIISDALWRAHFNADPSVVGRVLMTDIPLPATRAPLWRSFTIVGVAPAGFGGSGNPWQPTQYWVLIEQRTAAASRDGSDPRPGTPVVPFGRLRPDITFAAAGAAIEAAGRTLIARAATRVGADLRLELRASRRVTLPFAGAYYIDVPRGIATLTAVATILLIVAAANLAGMLMARGVARRTEMAIRLSLGISARRLVRQLLMESGLLAAGGAALGLLVARLLVTLTIRKLPAQLPGVNATLLSIEVPVDWRVLAFACGSCFVTALVAGVIPAVAATRTDLLSSLNAGAVAPGQTRRRLGRLVLVPQIALSLVLLLIASLFVRTMLRMEFASSGFDPSRVVILKYQLPPARTLVTAADFDEAGAAAREVLQRILDRLGATADVVSTAVTNETIQGVGLAEMQSTIIARSDYGTTNRYLGVTSAFVTSGYFSTLGIPLLRGRAFDARERAPNTRTAILSADLAEQLWPGRDPIGEWVASHSPDARVPPTWLEVIGVVGSVTLPTAEHPRPVVYSPLESTPLLASTILVRGHGHPSHLIDQAKRAVADAAPSAVITQARTLAEAVNAVRYPRRFTAAILSASGLAGLALAALGVFALMSFSVAQRLGEIGVRMVLGAERRHVFRLIVADGVAVAAGGIALGFALSFAAVRYASHAIVPLPDADAATFVVVPLILIAFVLLACVLPARRAARVDPLVVLRNG